MTYKHGLRTITITADNFVAKVYPPNKEGRDYFWELWKPGGTWLDHKLTWGWASDFPDTLQQLTEAGFEVKF